MRVRVRVRGQGRRGRGRFPIRALVPSCSPSHTSDTDMDSNRLLRPRPDAPKHKAGRATTRVPRHGGAGGRDGKCPDCQKCYIANCPRKMVRCACAGSGQRASCARAGTKRLELAPPPSQWRCPPRHSTSPGTMYQHSCSMPMSHAGTLTRSPWPPFDSQSRF
jgi:hypothetical protein